MKCRDLEELLSAYADGELSRTQREFIEEHLAGCADCRVKLAKFTSVGRRLSSLRETPETPDIRETTMSKIKASSVSPDRLYRRWLRPVMAAVAIVAVIALLLVAQPWGIKSPEALAASIVRNSPEVQAALNGEEIEEVEVTTKVVDDEGNVLLMLVRTEERALAAEVNLNTKQVTEIVRVNVPDFQPGDEQRALDIARADPKVRDLLSQGGVIGEVHLGHSIDIAQVTGPDGVTHKEGTAEPTAFIFIDLKGKAWSVAIDLDEERVMGIGKQSAAMTLVHISQFVSTIAAPVLLVLGVLLILGLAYNNRAARAAAGISSLVLGIIGLFIALYAMSSIWWRLAFIVAVPAMGLAVGITVLKQRTAGRGLAITGIVLGSLALAWVLFNEIMLPDNSIVPIAAVSAIIAGIIIHALKEKIMALKNSGKALRPVIIGVAAVAILIMALVQPWSGPDPKTVFARAHDAASSFDSYHMSLSAYTANPDGTSEQSMDVKFSAPDRYHVISLMSSAELPVDSVEYIIIGEKQYVRKFSDDFDINFNPGTPATESFLSRETTLRYLDTMTDIKNLPDETVNGVDCFHYAGIYDIAKSMARMKGIEVEELPPSLRNMYQRIELWIGKDDYLIRKMHKERQVTGDPDILGTVEMTMDYLSINEPVIIEPPVDANGNLLNGWELAGVIKPGSGRPVFSKNMTISIGAQEGYNDSIHQEVRYTMNLTNDTDESVKNVRITIATMLIAGAASPVDVEAVPETPANVMAPGESRTFNARIPFDASGYTKEQIRELRFMDNITIHFETESGVQMTESFESPPYPSAIPPENPPEK